MSRNSLLPIHNTVSCKLENNIKNEPSEEKLNTLSNRHRHIITISSLIAKGDLAEIIYNRIVKIVRRKKSS